MLCLRWLLWLVLLPAVADAQTLTAAPGDGITVDAGERFALKLRARAQIRDTAALVSGALTNELNVKTVRLFLQGRVLSPQLRYLVQLALGGNDAEPGTVTPLFDAWVEYTRLRDLNLRVGQYFVPFDRARTTREFALHLVDRAGVVGELSLDRDVGLTLSSADLLGLSGRLGYQLALLGGEGRNRFGGAALGFLYVARLVLRPFGAFDDDLEGDLLRLPRPRLALGLAGAYNQRSTRQRSTSGGSYALGGFDYVHAAADLVFKWAGVALLAELLYRQALEDHRDGVQGGVQGGAALREWSRSGLGYLAQLGVMVQRRLEVTGRWEQLFALGDTDPALVKLAAEQGNQAVVGVNLYLNGHSFKIQGDYGYLFGADPGNGRHQLRLQLDASF